MATKKQIEANRRNRQKWTGFSKAGLQRLRESTLKHRPWEHSTGPRTAKGKARSAQNGACRGRSRLTSELFRLHAFIHDCVLAQHGLKRISSLHPPPGCRSLHDVADRIEEIKRELQRRKTTTQEPSSSRNVTTPRHKHRRSSSP